MCFAKAFLMSFVPVFPQTIPSQANTQDGNTWNPLLPVRTLYKSKEWDCSFRWGIHRRLPIKICFWTLSGLFGGTSSSHPPMRYNSCSACWRLYPWMEVWTGPSALIWLVCIQLYSENLCFGILCSWKQGKPVLAALLKLLWIVIFQVECMKCYDLNEPAATREVKKVPWSCQAGTSGLIYWNRLPWLNCVTSGKKTRVKQTYNRQWAMVRSWRQCQANDCKIIIIVC